MFTKSPIAVALDTRAHLARATNPLSIAKVEDGEAAIDWLAQQLDMKPETLRQGLYMGAPNNDFTVRPDKHIAMVMELAKDALPEEVRAYHTDLAFYSGSVGVAVAAGLTLGAAFFAAAAVACIPVIAAVAALTYLGDKQIKTLNIYREKIGAIRQELEDNAAGFVKKHGDGPSGLTAELEDPRDLPHVVIRKLDKPGGGQNLIEKPKPAVSTP